MSPKVQELRKIEVSLQGPKFHLFSPEFRTLCSLIILIILLCVVYVPTISWKSISFGFTFPRKCSPSQRLHALELCIWYIPQCLDSIKVNRQCESIAESWTSLSGGLCTHLCTRAEGITDLCQRFPAAGSLKNAHQIFLIEIVCDISH